MDAHQSVNTQTQSQASDSTLLSVRAFDCFMAIILLVLMLPIMVFKTLILACSKQAIFDAIYIHVSDRQVALYQFSQGRFSRLPFLLGIIKGDIGFLGSAFEYCVFEPSSTNSRPGVFSIEKMQRNMGIEHINNAAPEFSSLFHYLINLSKCLICRLIVVSTELNYPEQFNLLGVNIDNNKMADSVEKLVKAAQHSVGDETQHFAFVNADCLNIASTDSSYKNILNQCQQVFADGSGIRIACQLHGIGLKDNVNGTDMLPLLCQHASEQGIKLFFLGATAGTTEEAATNLKQQYPDLQIVGCHHGYLNESNQQEVIEQINQSGAQLLLVGMGASKQEHWIEQHKYQLKVGAAVGVGGLFDYFANNVSRAPIAVRQVGMEWIWRLAQEPQRMWKRYVVGNPLFLARVLKQKQQLNLASATSQAKAQPLSAISNHNRHWYFFKIKCGQFAKRTFDIVAASILLILLAPLFALTALSIRIESKGAIFFSQTRSGKNNQAFTMWKFRSMYIDAEQRLEKIKQNNEMQGGVIFKMKQDPRITTIGKLIRKASIDELPQLWNVLIGDMSLVGPRPALPNEVSQYQLSDRRRLGVKPGITCIWQVSGRSDIPFDKQVELDIDYIYKQSLKEDITLLLKTIPAVLLARGAY
ncbi:WecB/TagA/CpsF family glycosyltransferase [Shewanella sp. 10N.286.52.B9]|uniref:WecB/TagA/CpsF family glycosyltransferase n=1 Tax=Shewanella sp. 10N.286.52.B9 TaxID=1880837 RepID=UPI000C850E7A|nr:WecB/TagA/CpsF family glycosyltransferase [Shewanella sp. 10N.286.52.B9]PMG42856.1 hypothetical protein BCU91_06930 [Shewanella sp. 10N.286.52.B9]